MNKKIFRLLILCLFLITPTYAELVKNVEINGNTRLSDESILVFTKIDLTKDFTKNDFNRILKDLYETNFFKNIEINIIDQVLVINVVENFIIENLIFNGIKNEKIIEAITEISKLKNRSSFNETILFTDVNNIKNFLKNSGYYFADVKTSLDSNVEKNTTNVIYNINLGSRAKIDEIVFIGDKKFKDRKLANVIVSEEAKIWKFISNKKYLNKERIDLDKRLLKNFYKNKGFFNISIEESFAEFRDNNSFKLTYNINAGKKFFFNNIKLLLPDDYNKDDFSEIYKLTNKYKKKEYSLKLIEKILEKVDAIALLKKYEFIDATISENIVDNNKLNFSIIVTESKKYYIEKINIKGNGHTIEEVIRNSLIVDEGDPFNNILFNKSINAIKSKGIFKTVNSKVVEGSSSQLKIVDIIVEEKATGEISLGAGAGTSGTTIGGAIKENNFLGKGISLKADLAVTQTGVKGEFTYSKPNFNYTDNTLRTSLKSRSEDKMSDFGYKTSTNSFAFSTSFEQYENLYFTPELETTFENLETSSLASSNLKKQDGSYFDTYFNYSLDSDKRNQAYQPTDGSRIRFFQELPIVAENREIVNSIDLSKYKTLPLDMIGRINFFGKNTYAFTKDVRVSKRAFIPASKLRGFEAGKVGPMDNGDYIGGNYITTLNMSATLPQLLPTLQNTDFSLFFDAANIWGVDYSETLDDSSNIRSSTGLLLDVLTPVGPMSFSWSLPLAEKSTDKTENFRFKIGTNF